MTAELLESRVLLASIYVDADAGGVAHDGASWGTAYQDLQVALAAAQSGDQILVASGMYRPTGTTDRSVSFQLESGVSLLGGYAGFGAANPNARDVALYPTILSGDIGTAGSNVDNSYHVVTAGSGIGSTTILDGFSITGGNDKTGQGGGGIYLNAASPSLINCALTGNSAAGNGGGMSNTNSSSPTLNNCTFSGNTVTGPYTFAADSNGGGICNVSSSPTLSNCTFSGNSVTGSWGKGGGMYNYESSPILTNCIFSGNTVTGAYTYATDSSGGGMYNYSSSPTLTNCMFNRNSVTGNYGCGGGMYNTSSSPSLTNCTFIANSGANEGAGMSNNSLSSPSLTNCTFSGNSAGGSVRYGGGMSNNSSSPTLTNCTFSGNSASNGSGGGIFNNGASPTLTNCTFVANLAAMCGGGMYNNVSSPTLANCIVWGNTAMGGPQISQDDGSTTTASYSDIQGGGFSGTGNIDLDPQFIRKPSPGLDGVWGTADDDYGDLRVWRTSPVIDAGNNAAPNLGGITTDLAGRGRFVDAPGIADTGSGTAPIVDMGAYEFTGPTSLTLLARKIAENMRAGTVVGNLGTVGRHIDDTFTYTLVDGAGSGDNAAFKIAANGRLKTTQSFDFEAKSRYRIRVRSADQDGLFCEKAITIKVKNVNEWPTDIVFGRDAVRDGRSAIGRVGQLIGTDPDAGGTLSYTLVDGRGSRDNARFAIWGTNLRPAGIFSYSPQSDYKIRVRVTDQDGLWFEKAIRIGVMV